MPFGFAIPSKPRRDIDAVAHQVAVALFDHIAQMDADTELDAPFGRQPGIALDHAVLHLDGAADGVDDATKLDEAAIACALHDAPVMHGDRRVDQSLRSARSRASVRSSSAPASRLYPTTSAASIAASFRVSATTPLRQSQISTEIQLYSRLISTETPNLCCYVRCLLMADFVVKVAGDPGRWPR